MHYVSGLSVCECVRASMRPVVSPVSTIRTAERVEGCWPNLTQIFYSTVT